MVDILDAARYLIFLSYGGNQYSLTPLKLQKILYLVQGWSYVWDDVPAFSDGFSAWQFGPVNEKVYEVLKKYGRLEIPESEGIHELSDRNVAETIKAVWKEYGKMSSYDLVKMVRHQIPWRNAYKKGEKIKKESIKKYFQSVYC